MPQGDCSRTYNDLQKGWKAQDSAWDDFANAFNRYSSNCDSQLYDIEDLNIDLSEVPLDEAALEKAFWTIGRILMCLVSEIELEYYRNNLEAADDRSRELHEAHADCLHKKYRNMR